MCTCFGGGESIVCGRKSLLRWCLSKSEGFKVFSESQSKSQNLDLE